MESYKLMQNLALHEKLYIYIKQGSLNLQFSTRSKIFCELTTFHAKRDSIHNCVVFSSGILSYKGMEHTVSTQKNIPLC